MARNGRLSPADAAAAAEAPLDLASTGASTRAPHFADWVRESAQDAAEGGRIVTTLDPNVQAFAESALRDRIDRLASRRVLGGAVVVLDSRDSSVLALVGSPDYRSRDAGQLDAALAPRQPGSAVKPFTYAVAFAHGLRPSTILADVPVSYDAPDGVFSPRNYAATFAGPVPARLALANSWNVPAVEVLRLATAAEVARGFAAVGLPGSDPNRLGLGLTLGAGEASLLDLAAAYATIARGGLYISPHAVAGGPGITGRPALDPIACAWVNEILSDPAARGASFGRAGPLEIAGVAAKTGTSSDWRDAWAFLYTPRTTVAVWMGNPDGAPTDRVTGVEGPAVVARAILDRIETDPSTDRFPAPAGIEKRAVCPLSGCAAGPNCPQTDWESFRVDDPPLPPCAVHISREIDVATGLLARPCTSGARRRRCIFVQLPDRFALWQADQGETPPPTEATECLCGRPDCSSLDGPIPRAATAAISIIRPIDGTVITHDPTIPEAQQALALEAIAPPHAEIVWRIDGNVQGRTRAGGRIFWHPTPGEHRITASLGGGAASADAAASSIRATAVSTVQVE
jgi:penicillin-binding protein 1C